MRCDQIHENLILKFKNITRKFRCTKKLKGNNLQIFLSLCDNEFFSYLVAISNLFINSDETYLNTYFGLTYLTIVYVYDGKFVYCVGELKNLDEVGEAPTTDISTLSTISSTSTDTQSTPVQDGTTLSTVQNENPSSSPKPGLKETLDLSDVTVKNSSSMNISLIDNLSNQIRIILKHFQHPDPIGLPGKSILPEPMLAENVTASLVVATGSFFNIEIYGLNNFSISVINTFLDRMEVSSVEMMMERTS